MRVAAPAVLAAAVMAAALATASAAAAAWRDVPIPDTADRYTTRSDCTFGRCGTKLCLLGGRNKLPAEVIKPASVFDTATRTWNDSAAPILGIHHFQLAPDPEDEEGDCVWAGGAFQGNFPAEDVVDKVYKFCAGTGEWSEGPDVARPRGSGGAVTYKGKYYLVAGNVGGHGEQAEVKAWFDLYDPATGKWQQLDDIPNPRDHFVAVIKDDKLYVAGGRDTGVKDFFNAVEEAVDVYDFDSGSWSTLDAKYPAPAGGTLAAVHGDMIVYGGGEGGGSATDAVYFFDGKKFTEGPAMLTPHFGTGFASCGGALWVAGGAADQGGTPEVGTTEVLYIGDGVAPACTIAGADSPDVKQVVLLGDKKGDADSKDSGSGLSSSSDGQKCFPAAATVQLEGGDVVRMDELNIGDRVRVAGSAFSEVYFFSHRDAAAKAVFVQITIEAARLSLTPGHVLRVNGKLAAAETVSVGDKVVVVPAGAAVARSATVVNVSLVKDRGLYNPHTVHGDVVVDGVVASCLTSALPAPVANVLLVPFKALFATVGAHPAVRGVNDAVLVALARLDGHEVSVARVSRMLFEGFGAFAGRGEL